MGKLKEATTAAAQRPGTVPNSNAKAVFEFGVSGLSDDLSVISFTGTEVLSGLFGYEVVLACPDNDGFLQSLEQSLLGKPSYLRIGVPGKADRYVHGVVVGFSIDGALEEQDCARLRISLAPRLWLLGRRKHSRIFQNLTVQQVIDRVLDGWGIRRTWRLSQKLFPRTYCTQYQETDYEFVTRLLAEEGMFHYFSHPGGEPEQTWRAARATASGLVKTHSIWSTELLVISDSENGYQPISDQSSTPFEPPADSFGHTGMKTSANADAPPALIFRNQHTRVPADSEITTFSLGREVRPKATLLSDFDFRRPRLELQADYSLALTGHSEALDSAESTAARTAGMEGFGNKPHRALASTLDPDALRHYQHYDHVEYESASYAETEIQKRRAQRLLEQLRSDAYLARGRAFCRRLVVGHTFGLEEHPLARLRGEYVVTKLQHQGKTAEWFSQLEASEVYACEFECAPRSAPVRPLPPPRRIQQVTETATVTGPDEQDIYTDEHGRIKVRFHWDLDSSADESSSCWIRPAQSWAGACWGQQFIPRRGMEVVVTFLGGDPDRPLVTGCVYNGQQPPAFATPSERTRSGLRTQSTPHSESDGGFNELSFEDAAGREQVYLRAQRDLVQLVQNEQHTTVESNQITVVKGVQSQTVQGDRHEEVRGDEEYRVRGNHERVVEKNSRETVEGSLHQAVEGPADLRFNGNRCTRIHGQDHYQGSEEVNVDLLSDGFLRVRGCLTTLVGRPEARRSSNLHVEGTSQFYSTDWTELESEKGLLLRCGQSTIRMTGQSIELNAPSVFVRSQETNLASEDIRLKAESGLSAAGEKVLVASPGASLRLNDSAKLCSKQIALNSNAEPVDDMPGADPPAPTTIELVDQNGAPIIHARYVVRLEDGSEISGVTDSKGKTTLELELCGEIVFPELTAESDA